MIRRFVNFSGSMLLIAILGCAATKPVKTVRTPTFPKFTSTVATQDAPSNITIALINPVYTLGGSAVEENEWSLAFKNSLAKEIEQLIISRGFKITGPFVDFNEMTFPQKKQSDLVLKPIIAFIFEGPKAQTVTKTDWGGAILGGSGTKEAQVWIGPCITQGFISFELWEPLSEQKMWAKRVEIEARQVDCS
ncbi:MAG: hypothetical protein AAB354_05405, partial [candidate division KSB1 bacterium]